MASRGAAAQPRQTSMTGADRRLLKMIKFKNKGTGTPRCTEQDYREAAREANVNAYDHDNFRKNEYEVGTKKSSSN